MYLFNVLKRIKKHRNKIASMCGAQLPLWSKREDGNKKAIT